MRHLRSSQFRTGRGLSLRERSKLEGFFSSEKAYAIGRSEALGHVKVSYAADATMKRASSSRNRIQARPRACATDVNLNIGRLEAISAWCRFPATGCHRLSSAPVSSIETYDAHFPLISLIPHTCGPTAYHSTYRDVIVVRAHRDLEPGEPVSIGFITYGAGPEAREAFLKPLFPNGTSFDLEERLKASQNNPKRQAIMREAKSLCKQLDHNYAPTRDSFKPEMYLPLKMVASACDPWLPEQIPVIKQYTLKAYEALGAKLVYDGKTKIEVLSGPIWFTSAGETYILPLLQCAHFLCPWTMPAHAHREDEAVAFVKAAFDMVKIVEGFSFDYCVEAYGFLCEKFGLNELYDRCRS
ncbi:hypothetical protein JCM11641_008148 [Rhodosporidiobolus odoratus]